MKDFKKILGLNIRKLRKEQNLSQEKLAELASLHRTYVGSIERGERNVSLDNIVSIGKALKIEPDKLLQG